MLDDKSACFIEFGAGKGKSIILVARVLGLT